MKNKKTILLISILAIIILGVIGVAYAYSSLFTGNNQQLVLGDIYMHYTESNELTLANIMPSESYDTSNYFEFTINGKNTYQAKDIYYEIVLNHGDDHATRTERIKDNLLKFTLVEIKDNTEIIVVNGVSYDEINGTRLWVNTISKNTTSDVNVTYRLYMWVSSETTICGGGSTGCDYDIDTWNDEVYASIKVNVNGDFESKKVGDPTLLDGVDAAVGYGGLVAINTDGDLYTGEGTIREYRYSGLDVNNYVYFNCKDNDGTYDYGDLNYNYASNCETWGIVGVFEEDGEQVVKIMRNTAFQKSELPYKYKINGVEYTIATGENSASFYWNDRKTTSHYSDWTTAGLQYYLNTESDTNGVAGYLAKLTSTAKNLINITNYYLGNVTTSVSTNSIYNQERDENNILDGNQASWSGKVALIYPSDYGYSVTNEYWNTSMNSYSTTQSNGVKPSDTSWMQQSTNHTSWEWLLSPINETYTMSASSISVWHSSGSLYSDQTSEDFNGARPCLYLVSTAKILLGTGESSSPYIFVN